MAKQFRALATAGGMMRLLRRTTRYAQVGLVCALLNNAVVIGMDHAGYHYAVSVVTGASVITLLGYLLHTVYTFEVPSSISGLLRFVAGGLTGFLWSMLLMLILCDGLGLSASVAIPIATVLVFAANFALATWAISPNTTLERCSAPLPREDGGHENGRAMRRSPE